MPKSVGKAQVDVVAAVDQAYKSLQGFIKEAGRQDVKLELTIDLSEVMKSIDAIRMSIQELGKSFQTTDGGNVFRNTISSLENLENSIKSVATITEKDLNGNVLEQAFKVDFADSFKKELSEVMQLSKTFFNNLNTDKIDELTNSLAKMSLELVNISEKISTIAASKGLNDLTSPEKLREQKNGLEQLKSNIESEINTVKELKAQSKDMQRAFEDVFSVDVSKATKNDGYVDTFEKSIRKVLKIAEELQNSKIDLNSVFVDSGINGDKTYAEAVNQISEIRKIYNDIFELSGRRPNSTSKKLDFIFGDMLPDTGAGSLDNQLKNIEEQILKVSSDYTSAQVLFDTPIKVKVNDESLTELSNKLVAVKNENSGNIIKIDGFDANIVQRIIEQLSQIVDAVRKVNITLSQGINFNPIFQDINEGNKALKEFKESLKNLGITQKSIPGFDNLAQSVKSGMITVEQAVEESQKRITTALSIQEESGAIQQSYIDLVSRIQSILKTQFPDIDLGNYERIFEAVRNGSMTAVSAIQQVSEAERKLSVNVPTVEFSNESIQNLQGLVDYLKKNLTGITTTLETFSKEMQTNLNTGNIDQQLATSVESVRQSVLSIIGEINKIGDALSGPTGLPQNVNEFNTSFNSILDSVDNTIENLKKRIKSIGDLVSTLFQDGTGNNSSVNKKVFEIKGLTSKDISNLKVEISNLKESINGLKQILSTGLKIDIDASGVYETEKEIKDTEERIKRFKEVLETLKSSFPKESKELAFFSSLEKELNDGVINVEKAVKKIKAQFATLNNLSPKKRSEYFKSLLDAKDYINTHDIQKALANGEDNIVDNILKYDKLLDSFWKKYKSISLAIGDKNGKTSRVYEIKNLDELKQIPKGKVLDIKFSTNAIDISDEIKKLNSVLKETETTSEISTKVDPASTASLDKAKAKMEQVKDKAQELQQATEKPVSVDINTTNLQNDQKEIQNTVNDLNKLQSETKEPVNTNIELNAKINKESLLSSIPENVPMEIIPFIEQSMLDQIRLQLESVFKASKDIKIEIPDNFANVLNELQTKLSATNTEGGRNLVEQIESITAALAMLGQIDLSNLNLSKAFNVGNGQNFEQLSSQLKTISEAIIELSKEGNKIPDNLFGGLAKVDDTSAINSINFVTLAEGLKKLKTAFKDFPESIPDLSNIGKFIKTVGQIKFNAEAIASFNSLNIKQLKDICNIGAGSIDYTSLEKSLIGLKDGIKSINQLKKIPDFSTIKVTKTNVDNLKELAGAIEILGTKLASFSGDAQKALKSLTELSKNLAGIKNIDKLLSLTPEKIKEIQNAVSGKVPVSKLNSQAVETYKELTDATKRYYEAKEMLDMNPSVDAINKEQIALEELMATYSKLEALERQGSTNASGFLSKYNDSVDAYTSLPIKNLLNEQKKALEVYKDSFNKIMSGKGTDFDKERLIESSDTLKSIQEQINQLNIEDNALVRERNNLLSQQSGIEDKYYASLKEKVVGQKKIADNLINEIGPTPLTNELFSQMSEMVNLYSKISSRQLFGDDLLNALKQFNELDVSIKNTINTITKNTSFKDYVTQYKEAIKNYKSSMEGLSKGKDDSNNNSKLVESYNKIVNLKKQINDLIKEGIQLTEQEKATLNGLSSQQSEIEGKYYSSLNHTLDGFQSKYTELFAKTGSTPLTEELANKITNMRKLISNISSGSLFGDELLNAQKEFIDLEESIKSLFTTITKNPDLKNYIAQYKEAIKSYKSSMEALAKGKETPVTNANLIESYNKIVSLEKEINELKSKGVQFTEQEKALLNQAAEIRAKYTETLNGRLSKHEDSLKILDGEQEGKLSAYAERVDSIRKKFEELKTVTSNITSGDLTGNDLIEAQQQVNKLENELNELEKTVLKNGKVISSWSRGLGEIGKAANGNDAIDGMKSYVESLKNAQVENTYVTDKAATLTYTIRNQSGEIQKVTLAWDNMTNSIKMVSVQGTTGLTRLGSMISTIGKKIRDISAYWMGMYLNPFEFLQRGRQAVSQVVELDTAMVELQKTTSATQSQLNQFYSHSNDIAKEYGNTTKDIINATADWSRMGYSLTDSENLAKFSSQFASISENLTVEDAGNTLISVLKGFGKETSDVLDVMNKINIVGNNFAVTNADIAEGLRQSSAAMHFAGNSLEDTIALFTAGNEVLRDASSMGSALKTVSMRIRGYDEETNQISPELENITGDIADLTHGKVRIKKDENTYNSTIEVLRQVAEMLKNNELSDAETAKLTEKLFAKTRANLLPVCIKMKYA